jgi:diacylglycerol kinase family enzyme
VQVRIDDTSFEAASVIVTKGRLYGGRHLLAPDMAPTRPGFTVALFERSGPLATIRYGLALTLGLLPGMSSVRLLPARSVVIEARAVPVQTDGDAGGTAPLEVRDADRPIQVVVA